MLHYPQRGPDTQSVIVGCSVHNQRIERLWRDLYSSCISFFYNFFHFLEDLAIPNCSNPVDIYIIHLIFLAVIQKQLNLFKDGWANHPLRTECNKTPLQLWILGLTCVHQQNPMSTEASSVHDVRIKQDIVCPYLCPLHERELKS